VNKIKVDLREIGCEEEEVDVTTQDCVQW